MSNFIIYGISFLVGVGIYQFFIWVKREGERQQCLTEEQLKERRRTQGFIAATRKKGEL